MSAASAVGFPLSRQQRHVWLQQQQQGRVFSAEAEVEVRGPLEADRLRSALECLVARHEILRTEFRRLTGMRLPVQAVSDSGRILLTRLPQATEETSDPEFDLENGPLLHAALAPEAAVGHTLWLRVPALCADSISLEILVSELEAEYSGRSPFRTSSVLQYVEAAEVLQEEVRERARAQADAAAQQRLLDLPSWRLPFEKRSGNRRAFDPQSVPVSVACLKEAAQAVANRTGAPLARVLLGGWQLLWFRLTGQPEITSGVTRDGRPYAELDEVVGPFAEVAGVTARVSGGRSLGEIVASDPDQSLGAPSWAIDLESESRGGVPFFYPISLDFDAPPARPPAADVSFRIRRKRAWIDRFKIQSSFSMTGGQLAGKLRFDASLFEREDMVRLASRSLRFLAAALADPSAPCADLEVLAEGEDETVRGFNRSAARYPEPRLVQRLFEQWAARSPERMAVRCGDRSLNYGELNARANRLGRRLRQHGVRPDEAVAVLLGRSVETAVAILAVLKAGGAWLPIDPAYPPERRALMLRDARVRVMITKESVAPAAGQDVRLVLLDRGEESPDADDTDLEPSGWPQNLAYVIYTSGSTGRPKAVMIPHTSLWNYVHAMAEVLEIGPDDIYLHTASFAFSSSVRQLLVPLCNGASVVIAVTGEIREPLALFARAREDDVTIMDLVPSYWASAAGALSSLDPGRRGALSPSSLRWLLSASEPLPLPLLRRTSELHPGAALANMFGQTETTGIVSVHRNPLAKESEEGITPVGRPIGNLRVHVLDERGWPTPIGVTGEIAVGGEGVGRGYLGRPEWTAERFVPDAFGRLPGERLYRTGDLGKFRPDGTLEFVTRADDQVKVRGFRVEPAEVEAALLRHPHVTGVAVAAAEETEGSSRLIAWFVAGAAAPTAAQLRGFLRQSLPDYMIPASFLRVAELPRTPHGKIDRRALSSLGLATPARAETAYIPPATELEEKVARVWSEVLGVDRVGAEDNFFALGGHSLLAVALVSRLRERLGIDVPLRRLFDAPTPRGLARAIEEIGSARSTVSEEIAPVPRGGPLAPSFAQERLWFLDQLQPGSAGYNVAEAARLIGPLDIGSLERSLEEMVRRHESLRTRIVAADGRPMQMVDPPAPFHLTVEAIPPGRRGGDAMSAARAAVAEAARRPFDLARGPLWRAGLLRIAAEEHVFFWVIHHIASDGWSSGIFRRELSKLYAAHRGGRGSSLPELSIQYPDYAAWQRERLRGGRLDRLLSFWRNRLDGLERLRLPTDHPRPSVQTYRGGREPFQLPRGVSRYLTDLARSEQVTPFITLLAAFQTLLSGYSGQDDVAIGTDVANRDRGELESLIGFFVNLLVLRGDLSGNPTFRELLRRTGKTALDAFGHHELPFEKVVEAVRPERSLSYTPLVSVLLVQNPPAPPLEMSGLTVERLALDVGTARFDLALFVEEGRGGLEGTWNYNRDLFDAATVRRMSSDFRELLKRVGSDPDTRLDELRAIRTKERRKTMSSREGNKPGTRGVQAARRRGVGLEESVGVRRSYWNEARLPLVLEPAGENVDLVGWAEQNRESLGKDLLEHGAVLFRGFDVPSPVEFERLAQTQCPQLFGEYGDLPREGVSGNVYGSTPYPADQWILFHNESSHMHRWPMKIFFYCVQASSSGGETPIVDCRALYGQLEPDVRERFLRKKLMYVRNYVEGLDVRWQSFFRTEDRAEVEAFCRKSGMDFEWTKNGGLRTRQVCDAVLRHPQTGETVFFNQIQLHHIAFLPAEVRESLLSMLGMEDLPRNVYYGDGTPIEDSVVAQIHELSDRLSVKFPWRDGDIVMLNNMLVAHSRAPFVGPRKIVVAMGEMVEARDVSAPDAA